MNSLKSWFHRVSLCQVIRNILKFLNKYTAYYKQFMKHTHKLDMSEAVSYFRSCNHQKWTNALCGLYGLCHQTGFQMLNSEIWASQQCCMQEQYRNNVSLFSFWLFRTSRQLFLWNRIILLLDTHTCLRGKQLLCAEL